MTIKGVLFDFSGTLLHIETAASWLRAALDRCDIALDEAEFTRCADALETAGALPGGSSPATLPPSVAGVWARRDESAELHREAYTALARRAPLPSPALADALYERHREPAAWHPYPDTREVLRGLRDRGVPVAVVSNIGWDLRPVFRAHGLDPYVDTYVLSYEHGVQKPHRRLFEHACERLGSSPEDVLMVGDDRVADGGAAELGCTVHFVDHLPVAERPDSLRSVLTLVDAARGGS